jgi:uncharacterized membrane protein YfcA
VATSAVFFAIVNVVKLPAFAALGQMSRETLLLALALTPVAVAGNLAGIWLVKRVPVALFYRLIYLLTFLVGLKLSLDGARALISS